MQRLGITRHTGATLIEAILVILFMSVASVLVMTYYNNQLSPAVTLNQFRALNYASDQLLLTKLESKAPRAEAKINISKHRPGFSQQTLIDDRGRITVIITPPTGSPVTLVSTLEKRVPK